MIYLIHAESEFTKVNYFVHKAPIGMKAREGRFLYPKQQPHCCTKQVPDTVRELYKIS